MGIRNRHEARFRARVETWSSRLKVKPEQVRLQRMTRKWASCSTAGRVSFSRDLLRQSGSFQDYVIVHELLHLRVPNHGRLFRSLMKSHLPENRWLDVAEAGTSATLCRAFGNKV